MDNDMNNAENIIKTVNEFYEENPFPGFDITKYSYGEDLFEQASWFGKLLDDQIPYDARILDGGCGTGQLASFLALRGRKILAIDYSQKSLLKAMALKERLGIKSVEFQRMNILQPQLPIEEFDVVMSMGVLHHTPDPYLGFQNLVKSCKTGGKIILGLYNTWGRMPVHCRRKIKKILHKSQVQNKAVSRQLVGDTGDIEKTETWLADQYEHPHESSHSITQVLDWFAKNNIDYINSIPPFELFRRSRKNYKLFEKPQVQRWRRGGLAVFLTQLGWIVSLRDNGGYFISIGQKR